MTNLLTNKIYFFLVARYDRLFVIYVFVSPSEIQELSCLSFSEELHNISPAVGLGLLNKAVWALDSESADLEHYHCLSSSREGLGTSP